jgi:hypothetical protein
VTDSSGNVCDGCVVANGALDDPVALEAPVYGDGSYSLDIPQVSGYQQSGTVNVGDEGAEVTSAGYNVSGGDATEYFDGTQSSSSPPSSGSFNLGVLGKTSLTASYTWNCIVASSHTFTKASGTFVIQLPQTLGAAFPGGLTVYDNIQIGPIPGLTACESGPATANINAYIDSSGEIQVQLELFFPDDTIYYPNVGVSGSAASPYSSVTLSSPEALLTVILR